jgi:hypothetical protein
MPGRRCTTPGAMSVPCKRPSQAAPAPLIKGKLSGPVGVAIRNNSIVRPEGLCGNWKRKGPVSEGWEANGAVLRFQCVRGATSSIRLPPTPFRDPVLFPLILCTSILGKFASLAPGLDLFAGHGVSRLQEVRATECLAYRSHWGLWNRRRSPLTETERDRRACRRKCRPRFAPFAS